MKPNQPWYLPGVMYLHKYSFPVPIGTLLYYRRVCCDCSVVEKVLIQWTKVSRKVIAATPFNSHHSNLHPCWVWLGDSYESSGVIPTGKWKVIERRDLPLYMHLLTIPDFEAVLKGEKLV